jgi:hypothetical protein
MVAIEKNRTFSCYPPKDAGTRQLKNNNLTTLLLSKGYREKKTNLRLRKPAFWFKVFLRYGRNYIERGSGFNGGIYGAYKTIYQR